MANGDQKRSYEGSTGQRRRWLPEVEMDRNPDPRANQKSHKNAHRPSSLSRQSPHMAIGAAIAEIGVLYARARPKIRQKTCDRCRRRDATGGTNANRNTTRPNNQKQLLALVNISILSRRRCVRIRRTAELTGILRNGFW